MKSRCIPYCYTISLGLLLCGCAQPQSQLAWNESSFAPPPALAPPSQAGALLPAPPGFVSFCLRMPDQCRVDADAPRQLAWTAGLEKSVEQVNRDVNNAIWPEEDQRHYGRAEYWTIPTDGYGDCEDYALTKRQKLMAAGFSPAALQIAIVETRYEGRHAVLTVNTDRGPLVLDNLNNNITSWNVPDYHWISAQQGANPMVWNSLTPGVMLAATDAQPTGGTH